MFFVTRWCIFNAMFFSSIAAVFLWTLVVLFICIQYDFIDGKLTLYKGSFLSVNHKLGVGLQIPHPKLSHISVEELHGLIWCTASAFAYKENEVSHAIVFWPCTVCMCRFLCNLACVHVHVCAWLNVCVLCVRNVRRRRKESGSWS